MKTVNDKWFRDSVISKGFDGFFAGVFDMTWQEIDET